MRRDKRAESPLLTPSILIFADTSEPGGLEQGEQQADRCVVGIKQGDAKARWFHVHVIHDLQEAQKHTCVAELHQDPAKDREQSPSGLCRPPMHSNGLISYSHTWDMGSADCTDSRAQHPT